MMAWRLIQQKLQDAFVTFIEVGQGRQGSFHEV